MSLDVISWVLKHSAAQGNDRVVLIVLADHAHDDGTSAYPSQGKIASKAGGITDRCVRDCLARLEEARRIQRMGKHGKTVNYRVLMDRPEQGVAFSNNPEDSSGLASAPTRKPDVANPESSRTQPGKQTSTTRKPASDKPSGTVQEPSENLSAPAAREEEFPPFVFHLGDRFADFREDATGRRPTLTDEDHSAIDYLVRHGDREMNAGYSPQLVADVIAFVAEDDFWRTTIRDLEGLVKHFGQLIEKAGLIQRVDEERRTQRPPDVVKDRIADQAWAEVRKVIEADLPASAASHWLKPIEVDGRRGESTLCLLAPPRVIDWFNRRYAAAITAALADLDGPLNQVEIHHRPEDGRAAA